MHSPALIPPHPRYIFNNPHIFQRFSSLIKPLQPSSTPAISFYML